MINDPNFKFEEKDHKYTYHGVVLPSTTGLIQEFGLIDYSMVPKERLNYKRDLGSAVDIVCHYEDERIEYTLNDETRKVIQNYVTAYKKFREITGFEPIHSKLKLFSKKWRFAGEIDKVGIMEYKDKKCLVILDTKCTWVMYPVTGVQLAGYKLLFTEHKKNIIGQELFAEKLPVIRIGLKLNPNGNYEMTEFKSPQDNVSFMSCLHLHYRKKEFKIKGEDYYADFAAIAS